MNFELSYEMPQCNDPDRKQLSLEKIVTLISKQIKLKMNQKQFDKNAQQMVELKQQLKIKCSIETNLKFTQ